jgi:hypothetical protein
MPYTVRKSSSHGYTIAKRSGGHTKVVGHSSSKSAAKASIRARNAAAHGAKLGGRKR